MRQAVDLPKRDRRVWELHEQGRSVSEISAATGRPKQAVREVITGVWFDNNPKLRGEWEWIM